CRTSRCRNFAALLARKSDRWTSNCRSKRKMTWRRQSCLRSIGFIARAEHLQAGFACITSFYHAQLNGIDHSVAHAHVADDHHAITGRSEYFPAQKFLRSRNRLVRLYGEIDANGKCSPIK